MSEVRGRFRRSRSNRVIAGVAGGLAERFGLSAWTTRALFIFVTLATSALGVLVYAGLVLLMPAEESPALDAGDSPQPRPGVVRQGLSTLHSGLDTAKLFVSLVAGVVALQADLLQIVRPPDPTPPVQPTSVGAAPLQPAPSDPTMALAQGGSGERSPIRAELRVVAGQQLEAADLAALGPIELRYLRNAVYARHGRTFQSSDLQAYFGSKDWYRPDLSFTDDQLTPVDRHNIQLIQELER